MARIGAPADLPPSAPQLASRLATAYETHTPHSHRLAPLASLGQSVDALHSGKVAPKPGDHARAPQLPRGCSRPQPPPRTAMPKYTPIDVRTRHSPAVQKRSRAPSRAPESLGRLPQPYFLYGEDSRPTISGAQQERCAAFIRFATAWTSAVVGGASASNSSFSSAFRTCAPSRASVCRCTFSRSAA